LDIQPSVQAFHVRLNGVPRQDEPVGDLPVALAGHHATGDLGLAPR
jgi:hypothetical protein